MNLSSKLRLFNELLNNNFKHGKHDEDIYALTLLNNLVNAGSFLPMTAMSLRPYVLAFLLNEMVINKRTQVIEFGAGISTIMMARLSNMLQLPAMIVSVEENKEWLTFTEELLAKEGLQDRVKMIHMPLEEKPFMGFKSHWYQNDLLKKALEPFGSFDMVMIDGPTACNEQIALSRYFALPFLKDSLSKSHVIFLDDANRKGEQQIIQLWKNEFGKTFSVFADTLGVHYQGDHFESNPIKYVNIR